MRFFVALMLALTSACNSEPVAPPMETPGPAEAAEKVAEPQSPVDELSDVVERAGDPAATARWNEVRSDEGLTNEQKEKFAGWVLSSRRPDETLHDAMSRVVLEHPEELTSTAKPSDAVAAMSIEQYIAHNLAVAAGETHDFLVFQPNGVGVFHAGGLKGVMDKHPQMPEVIQSLIDKPPPGYEVQKLEGKTGKFGFAAKLTPAAE